MNTIFLGLVMGRRNQSRNGCVKGDNFYERAQPFDKIQNLNQQLT
jgi:hypothetical protein